MGRVYITGQGASTEVEHTQIITPSLGIGVGTDFNTTLNLKSDLKAINIAIHFEGNSYGGNKENIKTFYLEEISNAKFLDYQTDLNNADDLIELEYNKTTGALEIHYRYSDSVHYSTTIATFDIYSI